MPRYHIREVVTGTDWAYAALHDLEVAITTELHGEDLAQSVEWMRHSSANERTAVKAVLVAVPGPVPEGTPMGRFGLPLAPAQPMEVLGAIRFELPTADNQHLLEDCFCTVRADLRREGIATALWRETVRVATESGRTTLLGWSEHHLAGLGPDAERLVPPTGEGWIPLDPGSRFARSLGLSLAQVERQSRLELPVPPRRLAELRTQAELRALPDYRVVSWVGRAPEEHLDRLAVMYRALSTDAPLGEVDWLPENWDADRVRNHDEQSHLSGHSLTSLAIAPDGSAAGLTEIHVHHAHPHRPEQWTTVVAEAHRGHRLGLLLKTANLQLLAADQPQARHVDTWNAGENDRMLAINDQLGFRPFSVHGAWQVRLA
ncbi:MAG: GNAT family N-acetyltransferase [Phenylobacterium zucineum]|nr:MAG: GNAT family N-acetyltransferase [Phenylobacterium zucineum]